MANLSRRSELFPELLDFRRDLDNIFNRYVSGRAGTSLWSPGAELNWLQSRSFVPVVDCWMDNNARRFYCHVALPGVDPKDVSISAQGDLLTVSGERKFQREHKQSDLIQNEFVYGSFERSVALPQGVDPEKVTAEYRNGVLEISAPISAAALPRRIEIKTSHAAKQAAA